MPHFANFSGSVMEAIKKIPQNKLIILDKDIERLDGEYAAVFQDFKHDINSALHSGIDLLYKYDKLTFVFPKDMNYPTEILEGFKKFCKETAFDHSIIDGIDDEPFSGKVAYIVLEETDLVDVIKKARAQNLIIGTDIGIISYNDTPLKEILADGITVISTDHEKMGETAAFMILNKKKGKIRNPFTLIRRKSL
jgi:DNA-binding LacI/PurR family transcriptional regulator